MILLKQKEITLNVFPKAFIISSIPWDIGTHLICNTIA